MLLFQVKFEDEVLAVLRLLVLSNAKALANNRSKEAGEITPRLQTLTSSAGSEITGSTTGRDIERNT